MKALIKKGATDQTVYLFIQDSSSTIGAGLTGLAYNTASLVCYYVRALGSATALTLATQTVTGAHSDGGFVEVSSANMPGWYRLDLSDAIVASGSPIVGVHLKGAANMAPLPLEIQLTDFDPNDAVRLGLTALPSANAAAAGGLATVDASNAVKVQSGTGANQISLSSGLVTAGTVNDKTGYALSSGGVQAIWDALTSALTTASSIGKLFVDNINATISSRLASASYTAPLDAAGTRTAVGLASANLDTQLTAIDDFLDTEVSAIKAKTDNLPASPAAVGSAMTLAADSVNVSALAADAVAEIQSGLSTLNAAGVRTAVGLASANLDTQLDALPTAAENADAVWDEVLSGHLTAGSTGNALNAAGSAGDPWTTALPGAYGAGSAGKIIGDNLNATIGSRATQTSVDTLAGYVDTEVAAIKAKTDNLPASPAAVGSAMTLTSGERTSIAEALLKLDLSTITGEAARSVLNAVRFLRNKWSISGATLTVTKEDDATSAWTATVTTNAAAEPVTGNDPS